MEFILLLSAIIFMTWTMYVTCSPREDCECESDKDLKNTIIVFDDKNIFSEEKADKLFDIITNDRKHYRKKFIAFIEHHSLNKTLELSKINK